MVRFHHVRNAVINIYIFAVHVRNWKTCPWKYRDSTKKWVQINFHKT